MQKLPHQYHVRATGSGTGELCISSHSLPDLAVAAPAEFDGPGDRWSPETLLVATVGSCLILTFRSIAQASRFEWTGLDCQVMGTLDVTKDGRRFTKYVLMVDITVPESGMEDRARKLIEKAEKLCLITRSLVGEVELEVRVVTVATDGRIDAASQ